MGGLRKFSKSHRLFVRIETILQRNEAETCIEALVEALAVALAVHVDTPEQADEFIDKKLLADLKDSVRLQFKSGRNKGLDGGSESLH